jgi:hypothetical protein
MTERILKSILNIVAITFPLAGANTGATPPRQGIVGNRQQQQEIGKSKQAKPQL